MADRRPPSLLLLPPPPHPATHATLKAAYEPPLRAAISHLKLEHNVAPHPSGSVLIVGVAFPILHDVSSNEKAFRWADAQSVLAGIYSIVAVICSQLSIPSEMHAGSDAVDVRVVFIDHSPSKRPLVDVKPPIGSNNTIIVDLPTFVSTYHPWRHIFHVNCEPGNELFLTYLRTAAGVQIQALKEDQFIAVEGGLSLTTEPTSSSNLSNTYHVVCLGGTFDQLHPGHKLLLTAAALLLRVPEQGAKVTTRFIIGVTGDELLKRKKFAEFVQSWDERVNNVIEFVASILALSRDGGREPEETIRKREEVIARFRGGSVEIQCVVLQDLYGPTITEEDMDVLIVSGETRSGGKAVNDKRLELGLREVEVFEVDVLDAEDIVDGPTRTEDFASKISSTAIRQRKAETQD
ncbi:cytidylyltransferase [Xylariaceae sp. FL1019]|nr:cytidylyltransferase [Xylariaceae sp. FL1019]